MSTVEITFFRSHIVNNQLRQQIVGRTKIPSHEANNLRVLELCHSCASENGLESKEVTAVIRPAVKYETCFIVEQATNLIVGQFKTVEDAIAYMMGCMPNMDAARSTYRLVRNVGGRKWKENTKPTIDDFELRRGKFAGCDVRQMSTRLLDIMLAYCWDWHDSTIIKAELDSRPDWGNWDHEDNEPDPDRCYDRNQVRHADRAFIPSMESSTKTLRS